MTAHKATGRPHPYQKSHDRSPGAAGQRLLEVYAIAARAAREKQPEPVRHALALLRSTLDAAASPEIALSLAALYHDIETAVDAGDFDTATRMLEELKGLWQARIRADRLPQ